MTRYKITGRTGMDCVLSYHENTLTGIDFGESEATTEFFCWLAKYLYHELQIGEICKKAGFKYEIYHDFAPSFEVFWERYNHKFDRKRAEDKWNKLNDSQKVDAINYIETYKNEVRRSGVAQLYAKTYLHAQVWKKS